MADTVVIPLANQLLTCVTNELALNPSPPAQSCLRAGDFVIHDVDGASSSDTTCCPGLVYVRIGQMYPSSNFPDPDITPGRSGATAGGCYPVAWVVELTMGTVRCIAGLGTPEGPSCDDWTTAAITDANDLDAMRKALCCWAEGLTPRGKLWLAQTSTVTMTGDCIERQLPILAQIPRCC